MQEDAEEIPDIVSAVLSEAFCAISTLQQEGVSRCDSGKPESRRTLHALGVRVSLAAALVAALFYGLYTGELRMGTNAPWHVQTHPEQRQPAPAETTP